MKRVSLKETKCNCFKPIQKFILIIIVSTSILSCSKKDDEPLEVAEEIKELIYFRGNENASTVLIYAQGGPSNTLSPNIVDLFAQSYDTTDVLMANVHQVQTLDPSILEGNDITLDQAVGLNDESVSNLSQVITYFKDQGRTVYVLGVSFGAFLTQELIAKKGINIADKYLVVTGRLDMNEVMWQGLSEGRDGFFNSGVTPVINSDPEVDVVERNSLRLNAGLGMNRYTQLFSTIEDLSKITYIYGTMDEAVGSLTDSEVQFLESKGVNIIAGNGNHTETFDNFIIQGLKDAFGIEPAQ